MRQRKRERTSDAVEILHRLLIDGDPTRQANLDNIHLEFDIAQALYDMREETGLTQEEFAAKVGIAASVIDDLEAADYEGHSFAMLRRIAAAMERRVVITCVPVEQAVEGEPPAPELAAVEKG
jgi:ribosome-binding protein aMBF1 (putative translation factor)